MDKIGMALFALSIVAFLVSDDFISFLWGFIFFNTSALFLLSSLCVSSSYFITEEEVFFLFIGLSLFLISGIFVVKYRFKHFNIDEMQE